MPKPHDVYIHCDVLEKLPELNRANWIAELDLLETALPLNASVLQIGCMDGTRILRLLERRPDLRMTGLDIDASLLGIAAHTFETNGKDVRTILADVTDEQAMRSIGRFDAVICLNNTLGYISDERSAIAHMRLLGNTVIISIYGNAFTNTVARQYFGCLGLRIEQQEGSIFQLADFGSMRRFDRADAERWDGEILETPLGYFCTISGLPPTL